MYTLSTIIPAAICLVLLWICVCQFFTIIDLEEDREFLEYELYGKPEED